ncbi:MAG: hypothetical protein Q4C96_05790 [Planctomycetia bacterium]|nr:hypothetical protein [Planctomycetia bacterium]
MKNLHFTILEHHTSDGTHWDLLLEHPETEFLLTWSTKTSPESLFQITHKNKNHNPSEPFIISSSFFQRKPDHRNIYLTYEGEISGGRGTVRRWDSGTYTIIAQNEFFWEVLLHSEKINAHVYLDTS